MASRWKTASGAAPMSSFFTGSTVLAVPALVMLWWLRQSVRALEVPRGGGAVDD